MEITGLDDEDGLGLGGVVTHDTQATVGDCEEGSSDAEGNCAVRLASMGFIYHRGEGGVRGGW